MKIIAVSNAHLGTWKNYKVFNKKQFTDFKKWIADKYAKEFAQKQFIVKSIRTRVRIEKSGLNHSLNHKGSIFKTKTITVLPRLLETALLAEIVTDKKFSNRKVAILMNLVEVDGKLWRVKMILKESNDGVYFYHHDLLKYERVPVSEPV